MLWWSQPAHWRVFLYTVAAAGWRSCIPWSACGLWRLCVGSAAGSVLAVLLLSSQMHGLTIHFHNLASSEVRCTLKHRQCGLWNFVPQRMLKAKTKDEKERIGWFCLKAIHQWLSHYMTSGWKSPRTWIPETEGVNGLHQSRGTGVGRAFLRGSMTALTSLSMGIRIYLS